MAIIKGHPRYIANTGLRRIHENVCAYCSAWTTAYGGTRKVAERELRENHGWRIRGGYWACRACVTEMDHKDPLERT